MLNILLLLLAVKVRGPVVQSVISLTSSLVFKMLTILVSTILNSQVFLLKKNVSRFCKCKSFSHFSAKNISIYAIFNDQSFNDTLINEIDSFEQLGALESSQAKIGPGVFSDYKRKQYRKQSRQPYDHSDHSAKITTKRRTSWC